ncbi:unnamed protein product [Nippostrongylus brasiliensis]|uniref:Methyl farnesoate epoxidase n=1 Tax=Nippostrongylus brasiliensis TaxID=27835 RepID=A0A0N4YH80_NIPBR|nr:unnamed protein product [Nippostrongylus brasiliensis]
MRNTRSARIRAYLFDSTVLPVLTYASESWALCKQDEHAICVAQRSTERRVLGVTRFIQARDGIRSSELRRQSKIKDAVAWAKLSRIRWGSQVRPTMRFRGDRWTRAVTDWIPRDVRRTPGRPPLRCSDFFVKSQNDRFDALRDPQTNRSHWCTMTRKRDEWKCYSRPLVQIDDQRADRDEMLLITLLDLWIAGQETTVTTLYWSFAYLLRNLDVMSRVEQELLSVTKGERPLSLADKPSTPYYNATLTEIHRCASLVPLIPWRVAAEDTTVGPYKITKGTAIASQNTVIMNDEKFFKHHEQFNPDRYLNGNKLDQMVAPFGLGKRSCLGESLARAELYLIIGNLLLRYKISPDPDFMPSVKATNNLGTMRRPRSYHICFEQR